MPVSLAASVGRGQPDTEDVGSIQRSLWVRSVLHKPLDWQRHFLLVHTDKSVLAEQSIDFGTTPSFAMPPCSPLNPATWIASWRSWITIIWAQSMISVWASHGSVSSAPWKAEGNLHNLGAELGSPLGCTVPCTLTVLCFSGDPP
jgi:hypothetical protein